LTKTPDDGTPWQSVTVGPPPEKHQEMRAGCFVRHLLGFAFAVEQFHQCRALRCVLERAVNAIQQHGNGGADDFQVAERLHGDIHQEVVVLRIRFAAGEGLDEISHGSRQLAIRSAELLQ
jgi:hypothetical protein